jgi:hypothetical protein
MPSSFRPYINSSDPWSSKNRDVILSKHSPLIRFFNFQTVAEHDMHKLHNFIAMIYLQCPTYICAYLRAIAGFEPTPRAKVHFLCTLLFLSPQINFEEEAIKDHFLLLSMCCLPIPTIKQLENILNVLFSIKMLLGELYWKSTSAQYNYF